VIPQANEVRHILANGCRGWQSPPVRRDSPPPNEPTDGQIVKVGHLGRSPKKIGESVDGVSEQDDRAIGEVVKNCVPFGEKFL
jgi:hypothetical protein